MRFYKIDGWVIENLPKVKHFLFVFLLTVIISFALGWSYFSSGFANDEIDLIKTMKTDIFSSLSGILDNKD